MSKLEVSKCTYNDSTIFIIGEIHTHQPEVRPNIYDICMNIINEYNINIKDFFWKDLSNKNKIIVI